MSYSVITPFIVPANISFKKRVNVGDGFILQSIQKLLLPLKCEAIFSSRQALSDEDIVKINSTKALILAGANQLHDDFSILPGMTLERLREIKIPILPFGVGIYGHEHRNRCMSLKTRNLLIEIHQRIKFSSWRCPRTVDYLTKALPELADKALMTGCPVMYGNRDSAGNRDSTGNKDMSRQSNAKVDYKDVGRIIVTVTDRGDFWERELSTLNFVSQKFKNAEKILSLHQNFFTLRQDLDSASLRSLVKLELTEQYEKTPLMLRALAQKTGFEIFIPRSVEQCFNRYENTDLHIGSRLHAHLYFLSQRKPSFLTYVDDRCLGFAEALDFPICEVSGLESYLGYDFSRCQSKIQALSTVMKNFICYVNEVCA